MKKISFIILALCFTLSFSVPFTAHAKTVVRGAVSGLLADTDYHTMAQYGLQAEIDRAKTLSPENEVIINSSEPRSVVSDFFDLALGSLTKIVMAVIRFIINLCSLIAKAGLYVIIEMIAIDDLSVNYSGFLEEYFSGNIGDAINDACQAASFFIAIIIALLSLWKMVLKEVTASKDRIKTFFIRAVIVAALLYTAKDSLVYFLDGPVSDLSNVAYEYIKEKSGGYGEAFKERNQEATIDLYDAIASFGKDDHLESGLIEFAQTSATIIINIIMFFVLAYFYLRLAAEYYMRLATMGVAVTTVPMSVGTIMSAETSFIFTKHVRLAISQTLILILTKIWLFISGMMIMFLDTSRLNMFLVILAWMMAGLKIENHLKSIGLDCVQPFMDLLGAASISVRQLTGSLRNTTGIAGKALATGAALTGIGGMQTAASFLQGRPTSAVASLATLAGNGFTGLGMNSKGKLDNLVNSAASALSSNGRAANEAVSSIMGKMNGEQKQAFLSGLTGKMYNGGISNIRTAPGGGKFNNLAFDAKSGAISGTMNLGKGMGTANVSIGNQMPRAQKGQFISAFKDANGNMKYMSVSGNGDADINALSSGFSPCFETDKSGKITGISRDQCTAQEIACGVFAKDLNIDNTLLPPDATTDSDYRMQFSFDEESGRGELHHLQTIQVENANGDVSSLAYDSKLASFTENDTYYYDDRQSDAPDTSWFDDDGPLADLGFKVATTQGEEFDEGSEGFWHADMLIPSAEGDFYGRVEIRQKGYGNDSQDEAEKGSWKDLDKYSKDKSKCAGYEYRVLERHKKEDK